MQHRAAEGIHGEIKIFVFKVLFKEDFVSRRSRCGAFICDVRTWVRTWYSCTLSRMNRAWRHLPGCAESRFPVELVKYLLYEHEGLSMGFWQLCKKWLSSVTRASTMRRRQVGGSQGCWPATQLSPHTLNSVREPVSKCKAESKREGRRFSVSFCTSRHAHTRTFSWTHTQSLHWF